jgi:hypothetical protein
MQLESANPKYRCAVKQGFERAALVCESSLRAAELSGIQ